MNSEERAAWLAGLKVGDQVVAVALTYCQTPYLRQVEKVTEDYIWVDDTAYSRLSGSYDGLYGGGILEPVSDSRIEEIAERQLRSDLRDALNRVRVETLPITTIRKLLAVLAEAEQQTKETT